MEEQFRLMLNEALVKNGRLEKENYNLQQRIDKAIEYIKKHTKETNFDNDKLIDILEILGDKE